MPERKTAPVELLARDALNKVTRPYGEDVILNVFDVIVKDTALRARYDELEAELTTRVVNQWLGAYTRDLTGMVAIKQVDARPGHLMKSYTRLGPPR